MSLVNVPAAGQRCPHCHSLLVRRGFVISARTGRVLCLCASCREKDLRRKRAATERRKAQRTVYNAAHREERRQYRRQWEARNRTQRTAKEMEWRRNNPEKFTAQRALRRAVRIGEIVRPETCGQCGARGQIDAHHDDYSRPLDVRWLCKACHSREHAAEHARQYAARRPITHVSVVLP